MKRWLCTSVTVLALGLGGVALPGCEEDKSVGENIDEGIEKTDEKLEEAGEKIEEAVEEAGDEIEKATD